MLARWVAECLLAYAIRLRVINPETRVFFWRQRYQSSKAVVLVIRTFHLDV
jgi:hypothetical protein